MAREFSKPDTTLDSIVTQISEKAPILKKCSDKFLAPLRAGRSSPHRVVTVADNAIIRPIEDIMDTSLGSGTHTHKKKEVGSQPNAPTPRGSSGGHCKLIISPLFFFLTVCVDCDCSQTSAVEKRKTLGQHILPQLPENGATGDPPITSGPKGFFSSRC